MAKHGSGEHIRNQYGAIVDSISDATYLLDTDRTIAYANQSARSHSDVSPEPIRGSHVLDRI